MKFAAKLDANKFEDWPYIDYKALKKLLKELAKGAASKPASPGLGLKKVGSKASLTAPLLEAGVPDRDFFLEKLREQRDLVQTFQVAELERNELQLQLLLSQMQQLSKGASSSTPDERSEASLSRAATDLYRRLQQLRNYLILNYTGLQKAAKKFDKAMRKQHEKETGTPAKGKGGGEGGARLRRWSREGDASPHPSPPPPDVLAAWTEELKASHSLSPDALDDVILQLENAFARHFCDGSVVVARSTLLVRKERPNSQLLLSLGARFGVVLTLTFWVTWDVLVDTRVMDLNTQMNRDRVWVATQMPLVRFSFAIVLGQFLWAGCLYVMNRARINFEFMLDLGPRTNTNAVIAATLATRNLIFLLLALLLFTKALIGELPKAITPGVFPVSMVAITVGSVVAPLLTGGIFLPVLLAPLYSVDLVAVLAGDVLTSLVKPLQDFAYASCYIATGEFLLPYNSQGACHYSALRNEVMVPFLCALPLWIRFMQCLRVFHDSHKRFPALPNALKYALSLLVVLFGEVHPSLVSAAFVGAADWISFLWIGTYLGATLYTFFWDVIMDWKLGRLNAGGLRERRMFPSRGAYYAAIAIDLVLRFTWTATLVPHWFRIVDSESQFRRLVAVWLLPFVTAGEMVRRAMWLVLRLESEHLHNTEGFRRVDVVPLHFDHGGDKQRESRNKRSSKEEEGKKRWEVLGELLVYAVVVAILAFAAVAENPAGPHDAPKGPDGGMPKDQDDLLRVLR